MKGIRISMPLVRSNGTCVVPNGYHAKAIMQKRTNGYNQR